MTSGNPRENLLLIAHNIVGRTRPSLMRDIELSFETPQFGPFHNEGPTLADHLALTHKTLQEVLRGDIHPDVPSFVASTMEDAANHFTDLALHHMMLHGLKKMNTMTFVFTDGRQEAITPQQWAQIRLQLQDSLGIDKLDEKTLRDFCKGRGIAKISYYQDVNGTKIFHAQKAADHLRELGGFNELLIRGIETYEIAFQFGEHGGINIPLFDQTFGDLGNLAVGYMCLLNYCDQMASLREDGKPDISNFLWLAKSSIAWLHFKEVEHKIAQTEGLDTQKTERAMAAVRNSTTAFDTEDFESAYQRIVAECKLGG